MAMPVQRDSFGAPSTDHPTTGIRRKSAVTARCRAQHRTSDDNRAWLIDGRTCATLRNDARMFKLVIQRYSAPTGPSLRTTPPSYVRKRRVAAQRRRGFTEASGHGRLEVGGSREDCFDPPEALTSSHRLLPPTFGSRNGYILRLDRSSRGFPTSKARGGRSRLTNRSFFSCREAL